MSVTPSGKLKAIDAAVSSMGETSGFTGGKMALSPYAHSVSGAVELHGEPVEFATAGMALASDGSAGASYATLNSEPSHANQLGKMYIDSNIIHEPAFANALAIIGFVPTKVEHLYAMNKFEYVGYSKFFEELPIGNVIPEYKLTIETNHEHQLKKVEVDKS